MKSLRDKIKRALEYKSSSFRLIDMDHDTELKRADLYQLLKLLPEESKEIIKNKKPKFIHKPSLRNGV